MLNDRFAYERVTQYAQTRKIFKEGSYGAFLGGVAGALVGAAVGGVLGGGAGAARAEQAKRAMMDDFNDKALRNRPVKPGDLAYGFIFFPAEAQTASSLRLQLVDQASKKPYTVTLPLSP